MAEPTVHIESEYFEGGVIINKADFDEKTHELFVEKPEKGGKMLGAGDDAGNKGAEGDEDPVEWTLSKLMKLGKDDLIALAKTDKGLDYPAPDDVTKETVAQAYLDAK
jgi:hypothetical protein